VTSADAQLPRPADGAAPGTGAAPSGKGPSRQELQAEVARSRSELSATIDALATRLSPGYQAAHLAGATRTAARDAGAFLTGNGMPDADARRARNAKVLLGAVGVVVVTVALYAVRRARH
jgi:hypothetical protein